MRKMLLLALALTAALAALTPAPKAEAACAWQCGLCGVVCPCTACSGPFPVCPCG